MRPSQISPDNVSRQPSLDSKGQRKQLRILVITSDKYPFHRPAAKVLLQRELVERGHTVDWLVQTEDHSDWHGCVDYHGGTVNAADTDPGSSLWHRIHKHFLDLRNDLTMIQLVRERKYDVIQVKDKYLSGLIALLARRVGRTTLAYWIAWPHAESSLDEAKKGTARYPILYQIRGMILRVLLYRILLPRCDHIFVQSEQMKRDFEREGLNPDVMTAIPGALDLDDVPFRGSRPTHDPFRKEHRYRIVYLGTLMRMRKLDILVDALAIVKKRFPDAALYFVGKGEMPEDERVLQDKARDLNLEDSVVFPGYLPMSIGWEYIRHASVCVSPYFPARVLNSTSPTKLIEYMAMGKPVVGNNHPEQSEVIRMSGGGICVSWSAEEFGCAIIEVLSKPEAFAASGLRGREYVERCRTNSIIADRVESTYLKLVEELGPEGAGERLS